MVNIALAIVNTLKTVPALAGAGRIWEGTFPQPAGVPPSWPAVRFTFVGNTPYPELCGDSDIDADDVRVQLDVVVDTSTAELHALRRAVILAMASVITQPGEQLLPSTRELDLYEYDATTKTHRRVIDFVLSPSSAA